MEKKEFVKKNVELEIRKGNVSGWWEVKVGGKKFVMKEVKTFYSEESKKEEVA